MIVVTGGAGFIGSALVWRLNKLGHTNIIIVDELGKDEKWKNLVGLNYVDYYDKFDFIEMILDRTMPFDIDTIFHLGACSATTEKDADFLMSNNYKYSLELAKYCLELEIRFIYASSAATYGDGSNGYSDNESDLDTLRPLNMYGYSKHLLDTWLYKHKLLHKVVGLKYFNVYGPNEYHKDDMRSVVHKAFGQIQETGKVNLFKSYRPDYEDGKQKRDFIYVKDAVEMTLHFFKHRDIGGIYNIGTGNAQTWVELVTAIFKALNKPVNIEFIDMPEQLREKYQYFTQADIFKIREKKYTNPIYDINVGVSDYVKEYLLKNEYLGLS
ncbi:MAG: ADP-glyceromanno-heptose 6-epimerase [Melioribacteraceae bacterium]|nr:ADP-glyceromanno-heptose 6-epimerase [Melioribacteraceae bacterium]